MEEAVVAVAARHLLVALHPRDEGVVLLLLRRLLGAHLVELRLRARLLVLGAHAERRPLGALLGERALALLLLARAVGVELRQLRLLLSQELLAPHPRRLRRRRAVLRREVLVVLPLVLVGEVELERLQRRQDAAADLDRRAARRAARRVEAELVVDRAAERAVGVEEVEAGGGGVRLLRLRLEALCEGREGGGGERWWWRWRWWRRQWWWWWWWQGRPVTCAAWPRASFPSQTSFCFASFCSRRDASVAVSSAFSFPIRSTSAGVISWSEITCFRLAFSSSSPTFWCCRR